jgi:LuxR family maltose regulon positive regulatory protein
VGPPLGLARYRGRGELAEVRAADLRFNVDKAADVGARATGGGPAVESPTPRLIEQLTGRELEVLAMLAAGRSNQSIAGHLFISLDTVKEHVSHLLGKLGAANRTEAVARGRELGLID